MDNPLTPGRIQRLIHLAEGKSFDIDRMLFSGDDAQRSTQQRPPVDVMQAYHPSEVQESSSGIIDLENIEAFGDSVNIANMSLSRSTAFNPGEMTGRSTGTSTASGDALNTLGASEPMYGRHSFALDAITNKMDKQTNEIHELMRHSIASNYSFHSKRDLTADEVSLINREAPIPLTQVTHIQIPEYSADSSALSMGQYFRDRCLDFSKILTKTDSPDRMMSITEVSTSAKYDHNNEENDITVDDTLDSVPVRQPRNTDKATIQTLKKPDTEFAKPVSRMCRKPPQGMRKEMEKKHEFARPREPNRQEKQMQHKKPGKMNKTANPAHIPLKHLSSMKPTDILLKNMHSSLCPPTEDSECSITDPSMSLSKIAEYVGKQSTVSVSDLLAQQKPKNRKQPLSELHMNAQVAQHSDQVTKLVDAKNTETASSTGTINTVINNLNRCTLEEINIPELVVTQATLDEEEVRRSTRSKSPSTKSPSTMSTVRDYNYSNRSSGFKSNESSSSPPREDASRSNLPSPNALYKELDKSVDWREVLEQKKMRQRVVAKENWVEIVAKPVEGFVGVNTPVKITVKTIADSWLTAKYQFDSLPNNGQDLNFEIARIPMLLSPGKSEDFTFNITALAEMNTKLPFTFYIRDASLDGEIEQKGELKVSFKIPVLQAMSADGMNKLIFPAILEKSSLTKTFVLISDCPVDLHLQLFMSEGDSAFCIKNVQEVKKSEVNKVLMEQQGSDDGTRKGKPGSKQLCRLAKDRAIRVAVTFNAPKRGDGKEEPTRTTSVTDALVVTLMSINTVLKKVQLVGAVGTPWLVLKTSTTHIHLGHEPHQIAVQNTGAVVGNWSIKCRGEERQQFSFAPDRCRLAAGESAHVQLTYTGNGDFVEALLQFEEVSTGNKLELNITGGNEKLKQFPIKCNATSTLSFVRAGRKEISLKNILDKRIQVRFFIEGDGFTIDLPGGEARGIYVLTFNKNECRRLPINFAPNSCLPCSASLTMTPEKNSSECRKIKLFGCGTSEPVRWSGLVTYSDAAALVRAAPRSPILLKLHNKSTLPAFVAAKVHFNLQFMQMESHCSLQGAQRVVNGRCYHTLTLNVDWPRVEHRARETANTALATVTVLTGAEYTRRRILKILKDQSQGALDLSQLPNNLSVLAGEFEGEDPAVGRLFDDFTESTQACLNELISSLQELTAHIDLPNDFPEEATIILTDDTIIDHRTILQ